jgi:hypothetical protein
VPPSVERLPPVTTLAPFFTASAMCASTFSTAFISISGPITARGANPSATFIAPPISARPFVKGAVNTILHQNAVGLDTGLAGIAVLRRDRAFDCHLDIEIGEDRS